MLGRKPEREILCFSGKVAAAAEAVAAGVPWTCDWFLQGVLHCGCSALCGCSCVRRYKASWNLWDYMGLMLGKEAGARNTVILPLKFLIRFLKPACL